MSGRSRGRGRTLSHPTARRALAELHDRRPNFDPERRGGFTAENGWHIDDYRQPLPPEEPGQPVPGGTWEIARQLMLDYEFADPRIVRAIYHPDQPLQERDMLLVARFYGLRFHLGVRVGGVEDTTREMDGRQVRVWGWNYRTLQGHLEMGQMDYEVLKWLDDGAVEFRIHAYSRAAEIPNPIVRLGFQLFGRRMQVRFARRALQRMERLTREQLGRRATGAGRQHEERVADHVLVEAEGDAGEHRRGARKTRRGKPS